MKRSDQQPEPLAQPPWHRPSPIPLRSSPWPLVALQTVTLQTWERFCAHGSKTRGLLQLCLNHNHTRLTEHLLHDKCIGFLGPRTTEIDGLGSGGWNQKLRCGRDHNTDSQVLAEWVPATPLGCTQLSKPQYAVELLAGGGG